MITFTIEDLYKKAWENDSELRAEFENYLSAYLKSRGIRVGLPIDRTGQGGLACRGETAGS